MNQYTERCTEYLKSLFLKSLIIKGNISLDIPFDVMKRGPLKVLIVGLPFACLIFCLETYFFRLIKNC